ncbi:ImmA/IrrE family metallo-endopeptidase [Geodermatophilus sp. DSM 45219]|uniref:ImmA/IrrE family metallo-endopeptidase n=1 Tax=Geodermatophilus sp. DSM 45219 TaxID=1881103 RepID=UPI0008916205|nr:ImmA/IrrE family metallo-endopeptidase [Geodermatophilus sp. DSM 45219]SDN38778.1 Zn-dependent peptidase ImmA, M78 family [Geodermatophilus sp. DSM 45219]
MNNSNHHGGRSVLASLRAVIPVRPLDFPEAMQIAELQAARLLELSDSTEGPVDSAVITELPRIRVRRVELPTSGMSFWDGHNWVIALNSSEPTTRQRFTLLHEYKHIIDHGATDRLYTGVGRHSPAQQAEQAADYFAGCALMPKRLMKRAWGQGLQRPAALARHFGVSERAIEVRLAQLGLVDPRLRCAPPSTVRPTHRPRQTYFRLLSPHWASRGLTPVIGGAP